MNGVIMLKAIWKCDDENKLISVGGKGTHVSCNPPSPQSPLITRPKPLQFITTETQILHWKTSGFGWCTAGEYEQIFHSTFSIFWKDKSLIWIMLWAELIWHGFYGHPIIHIPLVQDLVSKTKNGWFLFGNPRNMYMNEYSKTWRGGQLIGDKPQ